jgi:hypothetical protein
LLEEALLRTNLPFLPIIAMVGIGPANPRPYFLLMTFSLSILVIGFASDPFQLQALDKCSVALASFLVQTVLGYLLPYTEVGYEKSLNMALQQANESNRLKTRFVAWLSHVRDRNRERIFKTPF